MLDHPIGLLFFICACGVAVSAIITRVLDERDLRKCAREFRAAAYADTAILDAMMRGEYINFTLGELQQERVFLRIAYLEKH